MHQVSGTQTGDLRRLQRLQRKDFGRVDHKQSDHQLRQKYKLLTFPPRLQWQDLLLVIKLFFGLYDFLIWN